MYKVKLTSNSNTESVEAFYFDFHNKILGQHLEVRQAMAMAVDHLALIDTARRGQAFPLCTDHGKGYMPGYEPNAPCPKFNPTAVNALLDQNGWEMGQMGCALRISLLKNAVKNSSVERNALGFTTFE